MKPSVVMPPPGTFQGAYLYLRKDGDMFSTLKMNFGQDEEKNS